MEGEASWLLHSLQSSFSFLFFSFTIIFIFLSLLLLLLRVRPWCNCDVCHTFLTSSWTSQFGNLCDWYTHLLRKSPTKTIHIHILGNTVTASPENVEHILKTGFENYPKGKAFSTILKDLLGNGIFNVDGDPWRFQRKMASLELGSVSVRSYAFQIVSNEISNRLLPLLASVADRDGVVLDLQDVFRRFAFDNICKISFGLDPGCLELSLPMSEFAVAFDLASRLSARRATMASPIIWKIKRLLNLGSEKKLKEAVTLVNTFAKEIIRQRRKMGYLGQHDLLSRFMATESDDNYLRDIVISFLLAGRDTVASGLTSFFWLLSKHPDIESKVRDEIAQTKLKDEEVPIFEQLKEMHYLHAALYESMRLYPPVQFDSKYAVDDDVLPDGTFVAKGTRVTYHPYAMGRMEEVWGSDCLEFNPERWLKNGIFTPASPFKYPVFQAGLRVCLGKEMAIMEMKSVAVAVVRMFKIDVSDPYYRPKFAPGLTASLSGGLPVRVHRVRS
ncbi:cytochrome P450 94C1-like [Magnolia sinica]|uniref:cytochrome P450 94C1-like n=1 Tax=Magnolia sinica TaxID=86752 RepID=UPI002659E878|nr:cytochrome P450 94C1-like [Magnolia sinica]